MTSNNNNEPGHWKIPGSRYPHKEPWLTMRKDTVRLPNGRTIDNYYVWEYPPWINIIAATESREIVLIRQYRHGIGKVSYELSAGVHDKPDQSLLEGAQRESCLKKQDMEAEFAKYPILSSMKPKKYQCTPYHLKNCPN